ncbi:MAG: 30S ribosomal protein S8 [Candidatus Nealsonbacteria bacterium]|nr:30S ribosomal protein S8 [Candidatus Nealsonbacteria bacterium]
MNPTIDMLNRIRNAQAVLHPQVEVMFSNLNYEIAKILEKKGFIGKITKGSKKKIKTLELILKYDNKMPAITGLKKISKPGQRIYMPAKKIKQIKGGYGIVIVSTSKGIMTGKEARRQNLGGEIICEIW